MTSFDTKQVNGAFSPATLAFDEWVGTCMVAVHWKAKAFSFTLLFGGQCERVFVCVFGEWGRMRGKGCHTQP